jgi:hypothetical protein
LVRQKTGVSAAGKCTAKVGHGMSGNEGFFIAERLPPLLKITYGSSER